MKAVEEGRRYYAGGKVVPFEEALSKPVPEKKILKEGLKVPSRRAALRKERVDIIQDLMVQKFKS